MDDSQPRDVRTSGYVETPAGRVPRADTKWRFADLLGAFAVRWGLGRTRYAIAPGLYAVGTPAPEAPLLVTANYKLSFDLLRRSLAGFDAWVLVLDTKGINVWCAAGKGTFGTEELVSRMASSGAARILRPGAPVVLPQLGAPGVAAYEVQRRTGFRVVFGPVAAADVPAYLRHGMVATPAMRRVTFTLRERLAVVPVEVAHRFAVAALIAVALGLMAGIGRTGYRLATEQWPGIGALVLANAFAGLVLTPALLPWLPGRAFAAKGATAGAATAVVLWGLRRCGLLEGMALVLLSIAACSFLGLMFTGSTTYTSASGVRRELRIALPAQIAAAAAGLALWLVSRWR